MMERAKSFRLSAKNLNIILRDISKVQASITAIWNTYFKTELTSQNYVKTLSLINIDFSAVDNTIKNTVSREILTAINSGYGFSTIQNNLNNSGLGFAQASTLANTYISMYDNNYMVEMAKQTGVIYYIYDGVILAHSRDFCKQRVGRVYTIDELAKMDNGQGLPVTQACGGYNCTHHLSAIPGNYNRKQYGEVYNKSNHIN